MKKKINYLLFLFVFIVYNNLHATKIDILAKINNRIITNIDLEYRLNLAIELSNIPNEIKFRKQISKQILNLLIDENLKIQEAEKYGIFISSAEVYTEINRLEQRLRLPKDSLIENFRKKNIPEIVIYNQIRGQLLWNKIVTYRIANNVSISNKQTEEALQNFIKSSGEAEYNISEIFISASSNNLENSSEDKIYSIYNKVNSSNFTILAQQFSDGALNINNWYRESALNPEIIKTVRNLQIGDISKPIKTNSGLHIYLLNDKRKTKKIKENETLYNLSQIFFKITDNNVNEIQDVKNKIVNLKKNIKSCSQLEEAIKEEVNSSGGSLGFLSSESLDKRFLEVLEDNLQVGQLSKAIITTEGVHSIMLCEKAKSLNIDEVRKNIEQKLRIEKINNAANLLLNSIRQRALIEINSI
jgi:peptidyl-prolyl cis-trans isomerase SurA